jgi:hypothetical protein
MKFKIEIWHSTTDYQEIEIEAIDSFYALKYAREMYPKSLKINVKTIRL